MGAAAQEALAEATRPKKTGRPSDAGPSSAPSGSKQRKRKEAFRKWTDRSKEPEIEMFGGNVSLFSEALAEFVEWENRNKEQTPQPADEPDEEVEEVRPVNVNYF